MTVAGDSTKLGTGGIIFLVVALALTATTAYILVVPVDAADFETTTGLTWTEYSSSNPSTADYLEREARLLATGFLGLSLMAVGVTWRALRGGNSSIIPTLWLFPLTLLGAGTVFLTSGGVALGFIYLGAAAIAVLGLILTSRARKA